MRFMSPSGMETLLSCPQKYKFSSIDLLGSETDGVALRFGSAWHKIMELWRAGEQPSAALEAGEQVLGDVSQKEYRNRDRLALAFERYQQKFGKDIQVIAQPEGRLDIPMEWVPGYGLTLILDLFGIKDVHEGQGPELWLVDYKTASRLEKDWVQKYRSSNQFKAQYWAGSRDFDIAGVLVDILHLKPGAKKTGKTEEDKEGVFFYRLALRYKEFPWVIEKWKEEVRVACLARDLYEREGVWPTNAPKACSAYGGTCPFMDICDAWNPETRERLIELQPRRDDVDDQTQERSGETRGQDKEGVGDRGFGVREDNFAWDLSSSTDR